MALSKNEFGELVRAYRKQRRRTQEELAEHWGHSSIYISQIEIRVSEQATNLVVREDIPSASPLAHRRR